MQNRMREKQKHGVFSAYFHFHMNFLRLTAVSFETLQVLSLPIQVEVN